MQGLIYLAVLFFICFSLVYFTKLLLVKRQSRSFDAHSPPVKKQTVAPQGTSAPRHSAKTVYYLVEKKRQTKPKAKLRQLEIYDDLSQAHADK